MNIVLWILQVALAFLCVSGGIFQIFKLDDLKKTVAAMRALPRGVWLALGAIGCLAGVALLIPMMTSYAAAIVIIHSAIISGLYLKYGDRAPLPYSLGMTAVAAFIFYGRFVMGQ